MKQPDNKQLGTTKKQSETMTQTKTERQVGEIRAMWYTYRMTLDAIANASQQSRDYIEDVVFYRVHPCVEPRSDYRPRNLPTERRI